MQTTTTTKQIDTLKKLGCLLGAALYMMILGTTLMLGAIGPYLASYFKVAPQATQIMMPSVNIIQTFLVPIGGKLVQFMNPILLMLIGAACYLSSLFISSSLDSDSFTLFYAIFVCGLGTALGLTYLVPVRIGWKLYPQSPGLVSGIVIGGFGLGSLIFLQVCTNIVNPENLSKV